MSGSAVEAKRRWVSRVLHINVGTTAPATKTAAQADPPAPAMANAPPPPWSGSFAQERAAVVKRLNDARDALCTVNGRVDNTLAAAVQGAFQKDSDAFIAAVGKVSDADGTGVKQLKVLYDDALGTLKAAVATARLDAPQRAERRAQADKQDNETAAAKAEFEKAYAEVARVLAALRDAGARDYQAKADGAAALQDGVVKTGNYAGGTTGATTLASELQKALTAHLAAASRRAELVKGEVTRLEKAAKAMKGGDAANAAKKQLGEELGRIQAMLDTGNPGAAEAAAMLAKQIQDAAEGTGPAQFQTLDRLAAEIDALLKSANVKKEFEAEANEIALKRSDILKKVDPLAVQASVAAMQALRTQAGQLPDRVAALAAWRDGVPGRLDTLAKVIEQIRAAMPSGGKGKGAGPTTFEQDLKTIKATYGKAGVDWDATEAMLAGALRDAFSLAHKLAAPAGSEIAVDGVLMPAKLVAEVALNSNLRTAQENAEAPQREKEAKKKIEEEQSSLMKELNGPVAKAVKADPSGDKEELEELKVLGGQVLEKLKGGDLDGARKQLALLQGRKAALAENPGGASMKSAKDLVKIDSLWANASKSVAEELAKLGKAADGAAQAASIRQGEVQSRLDEFRRGLDVSGMVSAVKIVANLEESPKNRKAAREAVLRDVRAMRSRLDGDPLVGKVARNPFGIKRPFSRLYEFLDTVELNTLRAVKA